MAWESRGKEKLLSSHWGGYNAPTLNRVKLSHSQNACSPTPFKFTHAEASTTWRDLQCLKAYLPIESTEAGRVMFFKAEHP